MRYKSSFLLIIVNFLLFSTLLAQNKEASIKEIRQAVQNINNNKNLKKIVLRNDEFLEDAVPDGGGELTGYFKNGELVKIVESIGLSYGLNDVEYYLKNEKLIFAYENSKDYYFNQKKQSFEYEKIHTVFEGRYYFNNNQVIEVKRKGKKKFSEDENINKINDLTKEIDQYKPLLKAKFNKPAK